MNDTMNFFEALTPEESVRSIKNCISKKIKIALTVENSIKVITVGIDNRLTVNRFYLMYSGEEDLKDKTCAFSFKIGTQIYFFKSKLNQDDKGFFLTDNLAVFELKRRRHVRYDIPSIWSQYCYIFLDSKREMKVKCDVINMSSSGVRLIAKSHVPEYRISQGISFVFQIFKRAEILSSGIVRFCKKTDDGYLLGVEFTNVTPSFENKIENLCDDLSRHFILNKK